LTEQPPIGTQQKEVLQSPGLDIAQPFLVELSLVTVFVPPTSSEDCTQPTKGASTEVQPTEGASAEVRESPEHPVILPSSANPVDHPQRTMEEKGKDKAGDDMPSILVTERSEVILSPDLMADGAEDEARGSFPKRGTESEQPGMIVVTHLDEMSKTLRVKFLASMFKMKKFTQKGQLTILTSSDAELPEKTMMVEEHGNLLTTSPLGGPSFHVPADIGSLSDSDRKTERYLERMLLNAAAESPFAQVSSIVEVTEKILGFDHSGAREAEATTTKEVSALTVGKGEIRTVSIAEYESRLKQEGSIAS
jgi:hypothetical protein